MTTKQKSKDNKLYLLLHNIRSVHNVGSLFRTADAAGVTKIFLTGYTPRPIDRFGRPRKELSKVALGGEDSVLWEYHKSPLPLISKLKREGIKVIGLEQDSDSLDYKKYKVKKPILLIVGNEVLGMSKVLIDLCDEIIEIPMKGKKESLNVAVSTGIALFRILNI